MRWGKSRRGFNLRQLCDPSGCGGADKQVQSLTELSVRARVSRPRSSCLFLDTNIHSGHDARYLRGFLTLDSSFSYSYYICLPCFLTFIHFPAFGNLFITALQPHDPPKRPHIRTRRRVVLIGSELWTQQPLDLSPFLPRFPSVKSLP